MATRRKSTDCVPGRQSVSGDSRPTDAPSPPSGNGQLVRIGDASRATGISIPQLRKLSNARKIPYYRLPNSQGAHRLYKIDELFAYLNRSGAGKKSNGKNNSNTYIAMCRVSDQKRARNFKDENAESDLRRQLNKVKAYIHNTYGDEVNIVEHCRVASGLALDNPKLVSLINDIMAGKYDHATIVCTYRDRLMRFGIEMFRTICDAHSITIVEIDKSIDTVSEDAAFVRDISDFLMAKLGRLCSIRSSKKKRITLPTEAVRRLAELYRNGVTVAKIERTLFDEDYRTSKDGKITYSVIRRIVQTQSSELLTQLMGETEETE